MVCFTHYQSTRLHFVRERNSLWKWGLSFSKRKFFIHFKSSFRDRTKSASGLLNAVQVYGRSSVGLLLLVPKRFRRNSSSCSYFSFCTVLTCLHFCSFLDMLLSWLTWLTSISNWDINPNLTDYFKGLFLIEKCYGSFCCFVIFMYFV